MNWTNTLWIHSHKIFTSILVFSVLIYVGVYSFEISQVDYQFACVTTCQEQYEQYARTECARDLFTACAKLCLGF